MLKKWGEQVKKERRFSGALVLVVVITVSHYKPLVKYIVLFIGLHKTRFEAVNLKTSTFSRNVEKQHSDLYLFKTYTLEP